MMNRIATTALAKELMQDFAGLTGLDPAGSRPQRYLWTDAFAVCNYLGLFEKTGNAACRELALRLVDQVHHTLGRHRDDDARTGWISGLSQIEGERHPTAGGLRIGKSLPERGTDVPYDEQREWDRDGQYYHYLTKWMHALNRMSRVTGNPEYVLWAIELARTAHARFTYLPPDGGQKRMYWKMSIDLTRPLLPSMGQHDPLDGLVTYNELQLTATRDFGLVVQPTLAQEMADMTGMCRGMRMATDDPLGTGGLLCDASIIAHMTEVGGPVYTGLLETLLGSALAGLDSFTSSGSLELPARYRIAFREFGLSIGLAGIENLSVSIGKNPDLSGRADSLHERLQALHEYVPLKEQIEGFWLEGKNREAGTWTEHRGINMVMLATSLEPGGFLGI
ncbi:MAG: hypothetical protein ABSG28_10220 [Methanoregula sp.]|uniref:hypothetical protein n=1 Tax=Methanoregula sp. TaxID=2052170 RepID=UPI003C218184